MIVGMGIELVDSARFEAVLDRFGDRIRKRLFTARECAYAVSPDSARTARAPLSLAARFAAKLATRRALAVPTLAWQDIEVTRSGSDAPRLMLAGEAKQVARSLGVDYLALTLTHDAKWCMGQVILESAR